MRRLKYVQHVIGYASLLLRFRRQRAQALVYLICYKSCTVYVIGCAFLFSDSELKRLHAGHTRFSRLAQSCRVAVRLCSYTQWELNRYILYIRNAILLHQINCCVLGAVDTAPSTSSRATVMSALGLLDEMGLCVCPPLGYDHPPCWRSGDYMALPTRGVAQSCL